MGWFSSDEECCSDDEREQTQEDCWSLSDLVEERPVIHECFDEEELVSSLPAGLTQTWHERAEDHQGQLVQDQSAQAIGAAIRKALREAVFDQADVARNLVLQADDLIHEASNLENSWTEPMHNDMSEDEQQQQHQQQIRMNALEISIHALHLQTNALVIQQLCLAQHQQIDEERQVSPSEEETQALLVQQQQNVEESDEETEALRKVVAELFEDVSDEELQVSPSEEESQALLAQQQQNDEESDEETQAFFKVLAELFEDMSDEERQVSPSEEETQALLEDVDSIFVGVGEEGTEAVASTGAAVVSRVCSLGVVPRISAQENPMQCAICINHAAISTFPMIVGSVLDPTDAGVGEAKASDRRRHSNARRSRKRQLPPTQFSTVVSNSQVSPKRRATMSAMAKRARARIYGGPEDVYHAKQMWRITARSAN